LLLSSMRQRLCECLGLSEYEAKVYIALISAGVANARVLSVMSGVPRTKVYSVLKKLIEMGLIIEVPEEPKKFAATAPKTAFESYLRSYREIVENLLSVVSSLEETFKKAKNEVQPQQGNIWIFNGREEILEKIREMLSVAKNSVDLVTCEYGLIVLYKSFNRLFDDLTERSVKVRITTPPTSNNQHILSELKYTCKIEETNFKLPLIFLCIDKRHFLLANLQPEDDSRHLTNAKSVFSDNPVLHEMIQMLLSDRLDTSLLRL